MKLRNRVTLAAILAVSVSVVLVSVAVYLSMQRELRGQVDDILKDQGDRAAVTFKSQPVIDAGSDDPQLNALFRGWYMQAVDGSGRAAIWFGAGPLPTSAAAGRVAKGAAPAMFEDVSVGGDEVRVYTVPIDNGAIRIGRSLHPLRRSLDRLLVALVLIGTSGVIVAGLVARALAGKAIEPVHDLSDAAHTIKQTQDLKQRLPVRGTDEVASMAASFNELLDALDHAQSIQRQLVADASHELRTPMTTLRTNIEVLARGHDLLPAERDRILSDLTAQLGDLTELVGDLVDLAREDATPVRAEPVRLDEVTAEVVDRARRQRPRLRVELAASPSVVVAPPDRLERAISNLLDNAAKWSPDEGRVVVTVGGGQVSIRDEGPGIDAADLPHVFDRFYRSPAARQMPGSGLGLAIVKQICTSLGGDVEIRQPSEGGTEMILHVPEAETGRPAPVDGAARLEPVPR